MNIECYGHKGRARLHQHVPVDHIKTRQHKNIKYLQNAKLC